VLRFGEFTLDLERFELRRRDRPLAVQPKIFALLTQLVWHRDRVVTRAELFASVWPGVSVGQSSLNRAVRELRRALGDDERNPRFVATLPRRGYRFIAAVQGGPSGGRGPDARRRAQQVLQRVAAAHTFGELSLALQETGSIVDAAGTLLVRYTADNPILSGSREDFITRYRPEYMQHDHLQKRALQTDYDSGPHIALRMPEDELRDHYRSVAYNEFYRPLKLNDFICLQLTPGKSGVPGCSVLVLAREHPYSDEDLQAVAWLRDIFAASVARVERAERDDAFRLESLFDPAGHARYSAWDTSGRLLWHSPHGAALLGSAERLPQQLQAAIAAWCETARGPLADAAPPPTVVFVSERKAIVARLSLSRLRQGQPVVLVDFEAEPLRK
jgi:DNA-binding winged helix-turn-helix (wHTH) protein